MSAFIAFWILCAAGALMVGADFGVCEALVGLVLGGALGPLGLGAMLYYERTQTREHLDDAPPVNDAQSDQTEPPVLFISEQ